MLDLPFFLRAPVTMWRMVVVDQLLRSSGPRAPRVAWLLGVRRAFPAADGGGQVVLLTVVSAAALAVAIAAWRVRSAHWLVVVAVAQAVFFFIDTSFF